MCDECTGNIIMFFGMIEGSNFVQTQSPDYGKGRNVEKAFLFLMVRVFPFAFFTLPS